MMRNSKKRRAKAKAEATPERTLTCSLLGVAVALISALFVMIIFAIIALFSKDPAPVSRIGGYFALYLSAMIGGFFAYRKCGGYALLSGALVGGAYFVLTLLLSMTVPLSMNMGLSIALRALLIGASIGGAYLGAYKPAPKRRKRRK